jgi:hypothetical protein
VKGCAVGRRRCCDAVVRGRLNFLFLELAVSVVVLLSRLFVVFANEAVLLFHVHAEH